eukprot:gene4331-8619_t
MRLFVTATWETIIFEAIGLLTLFALCYSGRTIHGVSCFFLHLLGFYLNSYFSKNYSIFGISSISQIHFLVSASLTLKVSNYSIMLPFVSWIACWGLKYLNNLPLGLLMGSFLGYFIICIVDSSYWWLWLIPAVIMLSKLQPFLQLSSFELLSLINTIGMLLEWLIRIHNQTWYRYSMNNILSILAIVTTGAVCTLCLGALAYIINNIVLTRSEVAVVVPVPVPVPGSRRRNSHWIDAINIIPVAVIVAGLFGIMFPLMARILDQNPFIWVFELLVLEDSGIRGVICVYWSCVLLLFIPLNLHISKSLSMHRVISRKLFHVLIVCLFVPVLMFDVRWHGERVGPGTETLCLGCGVALCALLLLEFARFMDDGYGLFGSTIRYLRSYYETFLDNRDARGLVLTHIYLLLGCATPIWIAAYVYNTVDQSYSFSSSYHGYGRYGSWPLLPHLGWITVGVGDAVVSQWVRQSVLDDVILLLFLTCCVLIVFMMSIPTVTAAVVGRRFGRTKWPGTSRTMEGSAGGFLAMLLASAVVIPPTFLLTNNRNNSNIADRKEWTVTFITLLSVSLVEAFTTEIDNIVLPMAAVILYSSLMDACVLKLLLYTYIVLAFVKDQNGINLFNTISFWIARRFLHLLGINGQIKQIFGRYYSFDMLRILLCIAFWNYNSGFPHAHQHETLMPSSGTESIGLTILVKKHLNQSQYFTFGLCSGRNR